jgi:tetratricopeptide (TPR) repeat protein
MSRSRFSRIFGLVTRRPWTFALLLAAVLAAGGFAVWRHWTGRLLSQGEEALEGREYTRALEQLARYLSARPGDVRARLLAARAARRLRKYDEATEHLRRCERDGGDPATIAVEFALCEVQRGDASRVPELRRRALEEDDLALVILEVLIQYDIDTDRLSQALHELTIYLTHRPDDLQALLGRGKVWENFLYFADALVDYRKAVAAHPDNERARLKLADTLLIAGKPDEALEQYQWLARRWPDRPEVRFGLARCRRRLGEPEQARILLDGLLAEGTENGEMLWERGQLELEQGQQSVAEKWLRRAFQAAPHDRRVNYSLYVCLLGLERPEEAETFRLRVARIDADLLRMDQVRKEVMGRPDDAALRCEGGLLLLRNGERREGVRWLQTALRLDPNCESARRALADDARQP